MAWTETVRRKDHKPSRLMAEMLETATDMHASGTMDNATFARIAAHLTDGVPQLLPMASMDGFSPGLWIHPAHDRG